MAVATAAAITVTAFCASAEEIMSIRTLGGAIRNLDNLEVTSDGVGNLFYFIYFIFNNDTEIFPIQM